jgi:hypothetical protein
MKIGVFEDIPSDDYHTGPGVSSSQLKAVGDSLADYLWPKRRETSAMALGTAAHLAILEPDLFEKSVVVRPKSDRRTKEGKAEYQAFLDQYGEGLETGALIELTQDVRDHALSLRDAVMGHPIAAQLFTDGRPEVSGYWVDEATGILCKCRPDWLRDDGMEVSLKTARDASDKGFQRDAHAYGYHLSTAFYRDGLDILGVPTQPTAFVIVETDDPRPERVRVMVMDDHFVELGRQKYRAALDRLAAHHAQPDQWTGYPLEITTLEAPAWA